MNGVTAGYDGIGFGSVRAEQRLGDWLRAALSSHQLNLGGRKCLSVFKSARIANHVIVRCVVGQSEVFRQFREKHGANQDASQGGKQDSGGFGATA